MLRMREQIEQISGVEERAKQDKLKLQLSK